MGRRVQKVVETYDGSSWSTNAVTKFVWDLSAVPTGQAGGWLLIAELDGTDSDALTRTYTWGLDLSGTFQGAGGIRLRSGSYGGHVGGLLMVDDDTGDGFCGYYTYDGNGNVGQILDAEDLSTDAHYEYDPYGREIAVTGTCADDNPWRFSTKYIDVLDPNDDDASLLYYGFRYLSRRLGRWMSRDPAEEDGGLGLHRAMDNGPTGRVDTLGQSWLVVGVVAGGAVVAYYALVSFEEVKVSHQARENADAFCCQLEAEASRLGLELGDMTRQRRHLSGLERYVYCRHCLDCNTTSLFHVNAGFAKSLIESAPNTMVTGPIAAAGEELVAALIQAGIAEGSEFIYNVSATGHGDKVEVEYDYYNPTMAPCDLGQCVDWQIDG